LLRTRSQCK